MQELEAVFGSCFLQQLALKCALKLSNSWHEFLEA